MLNANTQRLENSHIVQDLCMIVNDKCPNVVFLVETKLKAKRLELLKRIIGFECCFVVELVGRSRGLVMLWQQDVLLEI